MKYKTLEEKWEARRAKARQYSQNHREKVKNDPALKALHEQYQQKYRAEHPERFNKDYSLRAKLKREYNLTLEEYQAILKEQNGVCAICFKTHPAKRLAVDHCHTTNKVRGLLCYSCNVAIGLMKDNPVLFENAIKYLINSPKQVAATLDHLHNTSSSFQQVFNAPKIYRSTKPL